MNHAIHDDIAAGAHVDACITAAPVPSAPVIEQWPATASLHVIRRRAELLEARLHFSVERMAWVLASRPRVAS